MVSPRARLWSFPARLSSTSICASVSRAPSTSPQWVCAFTSSIDNAPRSAGPAARTATSTLRRAASA